MKRSLVMTIVVALISIGCIACITNNSDLGDNTEYVQESPTPENLSEESIQNTAISEENTENHTESKAEDIEIIEQEEFDSIWYMDFEGIKNDELGVIIKKGNAESGVFSLNNSNMYNFSEQLECRYYDGNLDSYLATHSRYRIDMDKDVVEKGRIEDVDYSYSGGYITFAGNGIVISAALDPSDRENESFDDYLNRIDLVKSCDESDLNCLAYITLDGLYCPALGIKLSYADSATSTNVISVWGQIEGASIKMLDERYYVPYPKKTQVNKYVERQIKQDETYSAIEGNVEINIGKYNYLGRGIINQISSMQEWYFYSDETKWSVSVTSYGDTNTSNYEEYIGIIEEMASEEN